jgi:hypothetical protein
LGVIPFMISAPTNLGRKKGERDTAWVGIAP